MIPANVSPDFTVVSGNTLASVIGALLTIVLIAAVASLIASAISWVYGEANGNYQLAAKGKAGVLIALGTAIVAGGSVAWMNFLIHVGEQL